MSEEHTNTHKDMPEKQESYSEQDKLTVMELKFQGLKYEEISQKIGVPVNTLKDWFRSDGVLFGKYIDFKEKRLKELEEDSLSLLRKGIWNAVATLNQAVQEMVYKKTTCPKCREEITVKISLPTVGRVKAATEILNRVHGKAMENLNITGDLSTSTNYKHLTDEQLKERIRKLSSESGIEGERARQT